MEKFYTRYSNKNNFLGFAYLETIISLLLSTTILLSITLLTKSQFNDLYGAKKFFHKIHSVAKLNAILTAIITDIDSHSFNILPLINNSQLKYNDNSLCEISSRKDDLAIDTNSNSISYFKLNFKLLLKTKHYKANTFYLCPFFKKSVSIKDIRTYLALTSDDFFEVSLDITKDSNCYIAKIKNSKSLITKKAINNIKYLAFIPIKSTYTIYKAKNDTLRYVTHNNTTIVENQPILKNISNITFSYKFQNGFYTLICKLKTYDNDKKEVILTQDNLLMRNTQFNFISYLNETDNEYEI